MKIKEINQLIKEEAEGKLRLPKFAKNKSDEELKKYQIIMTTIVEGVLKNPKADELINTDEVIEDLKRDGITQLKKINDEKGIYKINSKFGSTEFYDAHKLFVGEKYPSWVQPGLCYSNCYSYVLFARQNSTILSGIAKMGDDTFLHSVVVVGNNVIDFNYNVVMSYAMYQKLFCFEVLAELDSKRIKDTHAWFEVNQDLLSKTSFQSYNINFAYEDLLNYIKKNGKRPNLNIGATI